MKRGKKISWQNAKLNKEELLERLTRFDREATYVLEDLQFDRKPRVIIVGGSAFVIHDYSSRFTHDIDVLEMPEQLHPLLEKYDMNTRVAAYLDSFPYNYEDRLVSLDLSSTVLEYFTPSLEDLVVSKLYGMRDPDIADITNELTLESLNWELLETLVHSKDEAAGSALVERRYKAMVREFEDYKKEYKQ